MKPWNKKPFGSKRLHRVGAKFYWVIKVEGFTRWQYEHRIIAENFFNQKLGLHDTVHHINGDTLDNRPENLQIMWRGDHSTLHTSKNSRWSKKYDCCIICGESSRSYGGNGKCSRCHQREYKNHNPGSRCTNGWSKKHDFCIVCKSTKYPHHGNGLCKLCRDRKRRNKFSLLYSSE